MTALTKLFMFPHDAHLVILDSEGCVYSWPTTKDLITYSLTGFIDACDHSIGVRYQEGENDIAVSLTSKEIAEYLRAEFPLTQR